VQLVFAEIAKGVVDAVKVTEEMPPKVPYPAFQNQQLEREKVVVD
jgi:hypothetical protein